MRLLEKRTDAYLENELRLAEMDSPKEFFFNVNAMKLDKSETANQIFMALEAFGISAVCDKFTSNLVRWSTDTLKRCGEYGNIIRAELRLADLSITPILNAHEAFIEAYGATGMAEVKDNLRVSYWKKRKLDTSSEQVSVIDSMAAALDGKTMTVENLEKVNAYTSRAVSNGWTYSSTMSLVIPSGSSKLVDLNYEPDDLIHEGRMLTKDSKVCMLSDKENINMVYTKLIDFAKVASLADSLRNGKPVTDQILDAIKSGTKGQSLCAVMMHDLAIYLQRVTYCAYEALYRLHVAEIDFSRKQPQ